MVLNNTLLKRAMIQLRRSALMSAQKKRKLQRKDAVLVEACAKLAKADRNASEGGHALVVGDFSVNNGLGRAARYDIAAVKGQHASLTMFDLTLKKFVSGPGSQLFDTTYFFCQPDRLVAVADLLDETCISASYRIGRWVWETPIFPKEWLNAQSVVHEVWTPSQFCADTFRTALNVPVKIVPHHVSPPVANDINMRERFGIANDAFMGVAIMDLRSCPPRKNLLDHVRTWKLAFGRDVSAPFIIKARTSKRTSVDVEEAMLEADNFSNIRFVTNDFSDEEIASLQHSCNVYVSLHRAEGFGLNIMEALLLNKPVLATDWSANSEYGPLFDTYLPVPFDLVPYEDWTHSYSDGDFRWAAPRVDEAAALLRKLRLQYANIALGFKYEVQRGLATD